MISVFLYGGIVWNENMGAITATVRIKYTMTMVLKDFAVFRYHCH
jgi:hypothetical protein